MEPTSMDDIMGTETGPNLMDELNFLQVPPGIAEILAILSQEIIRDQPDDILAFAAYFLEELSKSMAGRNFRLKLLENKQRQRPTSKKGSLTAESPAVGELPLITVGEAPLEPPAGNGEEEVDIDLTDPDVQAAAIKIQGAFKGLKGKFKKNT